MEYFLLAGPTSAGKSELAVSLAERIGGEVVCADAFQVYSGLETLVASPGAELRARCPHSLFGIISPEQEFNVGKYLPLLKTELAFIQARNHIPIITGGTGLYFRALVQGLSNLPPSDPALRSELEATPLDKLLEHLAQLDPESIRTIDIKNPRRVLRALEICLLTGKAASAQRNAPPTDDSQWPGIYLDWEPLKLAERILRKTISLMEDGAVEEVQYWRNRIGPSAREAIGFSEIQNYIDGALNKTQTEQLIAAATRQYAKRQRTWFRNQTRLQAVKPEGALETAIRMCGQTGSSRS